MADETGGSSSEPKEATAQAEIEEETSKPDGPESDNSESEDSESQKTGKVPYERFREVNQQKKEFERVAKWYRENIGDPDEVLAFRRYKEEQAKAADKPTASTAELTPEQRESVKSMMLDLFPSLQQIEKMTPAVVKMLAEQEKSEDAIFTEAEKQLRTFAKDLSLRTDEKSIKRLENLVGEEIREDASLRRRFFSGDMTSVKEALERVSGIFGAKADVAKTKRQVTKLPTAGAGASTVTGKPAETGEKGITKSTHDRAWAAMTQET